VSPACASGRRLKSHHALAPYHQSAPEHATATRHAIGMLQRLTTIKEAASPPNAAAGGVRGGSVLAGRAWYDRGYGRSPSHPPPLVRYRTWNARALGSNSRLGNCNTPLLYRSGRHRTPTGVVRTRQRGGRIGRRSDCWTSLRIAIWWHRRSAERHHVQAAHDSESCAQMARIRAGTLSHMGNHLANESATSREYVEVLKHTENHSFERPSKRTITRR
jgi:hypothetical protein